MFCIYFDFCIFLNCTLNMWFTYSNVSNNNLLAEIVHSYLIIDRRNIFFDGFLAANTIRKPHLHGCVTSIFWLMFQGCQWNELGITSCYKVTNGNNYCAFSLSLLSHPQLKNVFLEKLRLVEVSHICWLTLFASSTRSDNIIIKEIHILMLPVFPLFSIQPKISNSFAQGKRKVWYAVWCKSNKVVDSINFNNHIKFSLMSFWREKPRFYWEKKPI